MLLVDLCGVDLNKDIDSLCFRIFSDFLSSFVGLVGLGHSPVKNPKSGAESERLDEEEFLKGISFCRVTSNETQTLFSRENQVRGAPMPTTPPPSVEAR